MSIHGDVRERLLASATHLLISLLIASGAAFLVFGLWYPHPFRDVSGGWSLFVILMAVDVVLGPLLTGVVFNRRKPRSELRRDIAIIALIQLAALAYGLWSMYQARPIYLVHEVDRFVVLSAADIDPSDLQTALPEFQALPSHGVRLIGLRDFHDASERLKSLDLALAGKDTSLQPQFWQALSTTNKQQILAKAQPLSMLLARSEKDREVVGQWLKRQPRAIENLVYLPLVSRNVYWTTILDRESAEILEYLPIDAF